MAIIKSGAKKNQIRKGNNTVRKVYRGDQIIYDIFNYEVFDQIPPVIFDVEEAETEIIFKITNESDHQSIVRYDMNQEPTVNSDGVLLFPQIPGQVSLDHPGEGVSFIIGARNHYNGLLGPTTYHSSFSFPYNTPPLITTIHLGSTKLRVTHRNDTEAVLTIRHTIDGSEPTSDSPSIVDAAGPSNHLITYTDLNSNQTYTVKNAYSDGLRQSVTGSTEITTLLPRVQRYKNTVLFQRSESSSWFLRKFNFETETLSNYRSSHSASGSVHFDEDDLYYGQHATSAMNLNTLTRYRANFTTSGQVGGITTTSQFVVRISNISTSDAFRIYDKINHQQVGIISGVRGRIRGFNDPSVDDYVYLNLLFSGATLCKLSDLTLSPSISELDFINNNLPSGYEYWRDGNFGISTSFENLNNIYFFVTVQKNNDGNKRLGLINCSMNMNTGLTFKSFMEIHNAGSGFWINDISTTIDKNKDVIVLIGKWTEWGGSSSSGDYTISMFKIRNGNSIVSQKHNFHRENENLPDSPRAVQFRPGFFVTEDYIGVEEIGHNNTFGLFNRSNFSYIKSVSPSTSFSSTYLPLDYWGKIN